MKTSNYSIQYGTLNGIISISFSLMLFFLDQHYQGGVFVNLINFLISLTVILLAQIAFKKDNGGYLNLSDSLKLGLGISLINSILGVLFFFILSNFLDPNMTEKTLEIVEQRLIEGNPEISQQELDRFIEATRQAMTPFTLSTAIIMASLFFGFLISLITGLFLKKSKTE
tara:strand:- start:24088 stop:24597 length:510 start_codon:yes stop_codon:yes gene_type:complete